MGYELIRNDGLRGYMSQTYELEYYGPADRDRPVRLYSKIWLYASQTIHTVHNEVERDRWRRFFPMTYDATHEAMALLNEDTQPEGFRLGSIPDFDDAIEAMRYAVRNDPRVAAQIAQAQQSGKNFGFSTGGKAQRMPDGTLRMIRGTEYISIDPVSRLK